MILFTLGQPAITLVGALDAGFGILHLDLRETNKWTFCSLHVHVKVLSTNIYYVEFGFVWMNTLQECALLKTTVYMYDQWQWSNEYM